MKERQCFLGSRSVLLTGEQSCSSLLSALSIAPPHIMPCSNSHHTVLPMTRLMSLTARPIAPYILCMRRSDVCFSQHAPQHLPTCCAPHSMHRGNSLTRHAMCFRRPDLCGRGVDAPGAGSACRCAHVRDQYQHVGSPCALGCVMVMVMVMVVM